MKYFLIIRQQRLLNLNKFRKYYFLYFPLIVIQVFKFFFTTPHLLKISNLNRPTSPLHCTRFKTGARSRDAPAVSQIVCLILSHVPFSTSATCVRWVGLCIPTAVLLDRRFTFQRFLNCTGTCELPPPLPGNYISTWYTDLKWHLPEIIEEVKERGR